MATATEVKSNPALFSPCATRTEDECGDRSGPAGVCRARKGHGGDHVPWVRARGVDFTVLDTWPNKERPELISNEYEPDSDERCGQRGPEGLSGGVCFARAGHEGDHVPWYGDGLCSFACWSQDGELRDREAAPVIAGRVTAPEVRTAKKAAKPAAAKPVVPPTARQVVMIAIAKAAQSAGMNAGIRAMMTRKGKFAGETAAKLAGVAVMPQARAMLDDAITRSWQGRTESALSEGVTYPEVIIGGGLHAAVYAAARAAAGYVPPVVLEREARPGGTFGMVAAPVFWLNSGNRPGLGGTPGRDEALNYLPGAPVQPADISLSEYQDNADLGFIVRVTLAMNASVHRNCAVTSVNESDGDTVQVQVNGGEDGGTTIYASRVIDARGLGDPAVMSTASDRIMTFTDLMRRYEQPFPLDGMTRVAVIGGGDSGKCAVEALLGIGPSRGMTVASLDYVPQIDWYAPPLPQNCEDWRNTVRGRYARLGTYLPRIDEDERANVRRLEIIRRTASVLPSVGSVLVNGRPYSHAITCTGYTFPELGESRGDDLEGQIGRKSRYGELYRIGPASGLAYSDDEYRLGYAGREENRVAIFRWAPRTAALAAMLPGVKMPDPPKPKRKPAPKVQPSYYNASEYYGSSRNGYLYG